MKNRIFHTVICLLLCYSIGIAEKAEVAQKAIAKLAKLKKITDPIERDTQLIWQYSYVSEELARHKDKRTEAYLDTLRSMVELSDWDNGLGFYYRAMGRYHDFNANNTEALLYYDKAIEAYKPAGGDLRELAFAYVLKGFLLSNSDMNTEAWKVIEEGLPYARNTEYKNSLCLMLDWFGDYYYYGLNDTSEIDIDLALDYYLQVNRILPEINYQRIIAGNHSHLSAIYGRKGLKEKSDYHYRIADSIALENELHHVSMGLYRDRAKMLEEKDDHVGAHKIYLKTYEIMQGSTNTEFKARIEESLWKSYKKLGKYELALKHYETHVEMEEDMALDQVRVKQAEIESKYELAQKEIKINQLESSRRLLTRNLALGMFFLTLIGGYTIYRKNKSLAKINKELAKRQDEIQQAFYTGEKEERQRLAGELHDNVNTKLAAARWQLEAIADDINGPQQKSIVDKTILMMNEAYQDVRNISHNLLPAKLESDGLVSTINELLDNLNSGGSVKFNFNHHSFKESKVKDIKYPLYNIIYELVNNIMKHSEAQKAKIEIETHEDELVIDVSDNGQGYETGGKVGFGLRSIMNRVESLHGRINVQSAERQGTTTLITIPIR